MGLFAKPDHLARADSFYHKGELRKAAEMYLKARRPEQAAEVYAEFGDLDAAVKVLRQAGETLKAAELLDAKGEHKQAIALFDEAGEYRQAADACLRTKSYVRAGRYFEQAAIYRKAAESFSRAGEHEHALRAWEQEIEQLRQQYARDKKHGLKSEIRQLEILCADILENLGRLAEAARVLMRCGLAARAAPLFTKAKAFAEAAEAYLDAGRPEDACTAIEKAQGADEELRAEIYQRCGRHAEAAEHFVAAEHFEQAAAAYEQAGAWAEAAELWDRAERPARAAEHYARVGRHQDAGRCYAQAEMHEAAAEAFAKAGDYQSAAAAYEAVGKPLTAGRFYVNAGLTDDAVKVLQGIGPKSPHYPEASALLIPLLLDQGLIEGAEYRLHALAESGKLTRLRAIERLYLTGRIEEAKGRIEDAQIAYQKVVSERHDFSDAGERLRRVRDQLAAPVPPQVDLRHTAPVALDELPGGQPASAAFADTGTMPVPLTDSGAMRAAAQLPPDLTALPFDLGEPAECWWEGATFFTAFDRRSNESGLLVSFPQHLVGSASELEAFRLTMGGLVDLDHERVLKLREVVFTNDDVVLFYEKYPGRTLGSLLTYLGHQGPNTVLNILTQLCDVLTTALKLNLSHQWLSPQTILVDARSRIKLAGFGLREVLAGLSHTSTAYVSPEVRRGQAAGPAADVYSVGLLGIELLQAQLPADWATQPALDPEAVGWPEDIEDGVPRRLRALLIRCLRNSPVDRPSTEEIKTALASVGLVEGQILVDRYEILGELGRGGMSRVYRAHDRQFDDEVAIKTVLTAASGSTEDQDRLLREVQICRKISHPNVVRVHDFGRFPGGIFVIMELLKGPGLDRIIEQEAPLPLARVKTMLTEIAAALGEAHRLKIIHRDLKPGNVMFVDDRAKVMDFGIARMSDGSTQKLTQAGEVIGSPLYMAPEQIQGLALGGTCDLYSLGVIAYTMLCGQEPFQAETATAVAFKHLHEPPPDLSAVRPDLTPDWIAMLHKLLAKKPEDRYQTAAELTAALASLPV